MEFTDGQIAGLVLGYLKSEECLTAFSSFLNECHYFDGNREEVQAGKHFPTRVFGMSLVEFLEEYAMIYSLVQARLEATNYYKENRHKTSLGIVKHLLYLLDMVPLQNSTPISKSSISEIDTTLSHTLPGNSEESPNAVHRVTPKRRNQKLKGFNKLSNDDLDTSEVIAQTLLDKTELHVKLANTINIVRNSPEIGKTEDVISSGASKELEAIIKSVVQRTEEDPMYNRLIDELVGNPTFDNAISKNVLNSSINLNESRTKRTKSTANHCVDVNVEYGNENAVQGILSSSQVIETCSSLTSNVTTTPTQQQQQNEASGTSGSANTIYVFDGTLDTYIKSNTPTTAINPLFVGGAKQYYVINSQPILNMKNVVSETDIMAMPTIIVNDGTVTEITPSDGIEKTFENSNVVPKHSTPPTNPDVSNLVPLHISIADPPTVQSNLKQSSDNNTPVLTVSEKQSKVPSSTVNTCPPLDSNSELMPVENITPVKTTTKKGKKSPTLPTTNETVLENKNSILKENIPIGPESESISPDRIGSIQTRQNTPRHVRNLDFCSPVINENTGRKQWDADLRSLIGVYPKSSEASRYKKKPTTKTRKKPGTKMKSKEMDCTDSQGDEKLENTETEAPDSSEGKEDTTFATENENNLTKSDEIVIIHDTPIKDRIPKTPGLGTNFTPFTQAIEEQLRGVDLMSMPTPNIPITPGFALTPFDSTHRNQRGTDYSASSSYYVPSDTEQNKSLEKLMEENNLPEPTYVKILSNVILEQGENNVNQTETLKDDVGKKLAHISIGRKNLDLIKPSVSSNSSSSSSSESESENSDESNNKTIIKKKEEPLSSKKESNEKMIHNIISRIPNSAKLTVEKKGEQEALRIALEEKRKRTIERIQAPQKRKPRITPKPKNPPRSCKNTRTVRSNNTRNKKNIFPEINEETANKKNKSQISEEVPVQVPTENKDLVADLWQRGIHLIPNKPSKKICDEQSGKITETKPETSVMSTDDEEIVFDKSNNHFYTEIIRCETDHKKITKSYDLTLLDKHFKATIYDDYCNDNVTRTLRCTQFEVLMNLSPKPLLKRSRRNQSSSKKITADTNCHINNETTNNVTIICSKEEFVESKNLKNPRKRKLRNSDQDKSTEKKSKKLDNNMQLLQKLEKLDVDDFLDKVHKN